MNPTLNCPAKVGDRIEYAGRPTGLSYPRSGKVIVVVAGHQAVVEEVERVAVPELDVDELRPVIYFRFGKLALRYVIPPDNWRAWRGLKR